MNFLTRVAVVLLGVVVLSACTQQRYSERWNFVGASLGDDAGTNKFIDVLQQSKDVGCTHILMPEGRWLRLSEDPAYLARVEKVKAKASELHLTLVPMIYSMGYSGRYLAFDPNLAAGLPVHEMPFVVTGKAATADPAAALDTTALQSGAGSATIKVQPFMHYRITFTTSAAAPAAETRPAGRRDRGGAGSVSVRAVTPARNLTRREPDSRVEGNVKTVTTTFNTLEAREVKVTVTGDVRNLKIEPAGLLAVIRRDLVPLNVSSADGKTVYQEGVDFKPVSDPKLTTDGEYLFDHDAPALQLTDNTSIKSGQKLLVSFWHAFRIGGDQDLISMEDPKVFEIMEKDLTTCLKVWNPAGVCMNYDEIRIAGWENQPDGRRRTPGQELAAHVQRGYDMIKQHAPKAKVYTWSDMFTPLHNAHPLDKGGPYYLVNGTWDGSWQGLPSDVIILNWYAPDDRSIKFFAERGHQQVLCGYYDAPAPERMKSNIAKWINISKDSKGILGIMYTTWNHNFAPMKDYFHLLDTFDQWKATAPNLPPES